MSKLRDLIDKDLISEIDRHQASVEMNNLAMETYRNFVEDLRRTPIRGNALMKTDEKRLTNRIMVENIGRMCLFWYLPKLREKLPYYDRFPLVMPIQMDRTGFLGLNLHYLPPKHRAILLDTLIRNVVKRNFTSETKRIRLSYSIMKRSIRSPLFIPCVKRYLYTHLKSRIYMLDPRDWAFSLFLPLERFEKANQSRVYLESMRKVRNYGTI